MNRVAIAFSTCDRVELSRQSIEPLLQPDKFDLFWIDGSKTEAGKKLGYEYGCDDEHGLDFHTGITGGSGAAIVYALTTMLSYHVLTPANEPAQRYYDYVGLVENDVVLDKDWFYRTMALFYRGTEYGLEVGAVSARCYEDRILCQRDGYAVCHNLGAGMVIFTREAAQLVLNQYRVQWTTENRAIFAQLAGVDIGRWWAFQGSEHFLVADWRWDALLASKGLASLALTPSPISMIGQTPSLAEQGLVLATSEVEAMRNTPRFELYRDNLARIRSGDLVMPDSLFHRDTARGQTIFAHQIAAIGGSYAGSYKLRDAPGFGPFGWTATELEACTVHLPVYGPCEIMVGGGKEGGQIHVVDETSGFDARPVLPPEGGAGQLVAVNIPGNYSYRTVRVELSPGTIFYAVRCRDEQPVKGGFKFDWNVLPKGR
jgi:hypothetical protein